MEIDEMKRIVVDSSASLYKLDGIDFASVPLKIVTDEREYLDDGTLNAVEILDTMRLDAFRLWVASGICLHSQRPEKPELDKLAALYFKLAPALPSSNKYECALRIQRVSSVIRRLQEKHGLAANCVVEMAYGVCLLNVPASKVPLSDFYETVDSNCQGMRDDAIEVMGVLCDLYSLIGQ